MWYELGQRSVSDARIAVDTGKKQVPVNRGVAIFTDVASNGMVGGHPRGSEIVVAALAPKIEPGMVEARKPPVLLRMAG